jgi:hypothetical protein
VFDKCTINVRHLQAFNLIQYTPMSINKPKAASLSVRLPNKTRTRFIVKAKNYGSPSEVLRELVDAFVEERVAIQPPVTRKEKLYVPRDEN